jgi:hypothetical protein
VPNASRSLSIWAFKNMAHVQPEAGLIVNLDACVVVAQSIIGAVGGGFLAFVFPILCYTAIFRARAIPSPPVLPATGAGADNGTDHDPELTEISLQFFICTSHYLHPHPSSA